MTSSPESVDEMLARINAELRASDEAERPERERRDRFIGPPDTRGELLAHIKTGNIYAAYILAVGDKGAFQVGYVGMGESMVHKLSEAIDQTLRKLVADGKVIRGDWVDDQLPEYNVSDPTKPGSGHNLLAVTGHRLRPVGWKASILLSK